MGDTPVYQFPADCLPGVGEVWSGQYDFPARIDGPFTVLDIGANCGAWALRMRRIYPLCRVECYEPHPDIFAFLQRNTAADARVRCHHAAVGDPALTLLKPGLDTRLCSSVYQIGRQTDLVVIPVRVTPPDQLPPADVIKVDTEGAEGYIVEHLAHTPALLVVEYHTDFLRERVQAALAGKMILVRALVNGPGWGHLTYARH